MANILTETFMSGFRLFEGEKFSRLQSKLNLIFAGTTQVDRLSAIFMDLGTVTGLTAAGTTRADALQLTVAQNNLTTVASGTGVILQPISTVGIGGSVLILNNGANAAKVYASGSETIDGTAGATGVTLTNGTTNGRCLYIAFSATVWISMKFGIPSA